MFGWDFEVDTCSRFWRCLIKIWVRTCNMNSTLGSVVPLAMFFFRVFPWKYWSTLYCVHNVKIQVETTFFTYFAIVISYDSSDKGDDESGHSQQRCRPPPFPTLSILSIFTLTLSTFGNSPHKLKIFLKHEISNLCLYTWYCCHDNDIWQSQISDKFMYMLQLTWNVS